MGEGDGDGSGDAAGLGLGVVAGDALGDWDRAARDPLEAPTLHALTHTSRAASKAGRTILEG